MLVSACVVFSTFAGGDTCDEPLCSTLRVTFSGHVYRTLAYSRNNANVGDIGCMNWDGFSCNPGRFGANGDRETATNGTAAKPAKVHVASAAEPTSANYDHSDTTWYRGACTHACWLLWLVSALRSEFTLCPTQCVGAD